MRDLVLMPLLNMLTLSAAKLIMSRFREWLSNAEFLRLHYSFSLKTFSLTSRTEEGTIRSPKRKVLLILDLFRPSRVIS